MFYNINPNFLSAYSFISSRNSAQSAYLSSLWLAVAFCIIASNSLSILSLLSDGVCLKKACGFLAFMPTSFNDENDGTGSVPDRLSQSVTPVAKTSALASVASPRACSGGMYSGVPRTKADSSSVCSVRAIPKSAKYDRPLPRSIRMLPGFTSWCTTPDRLA